MRNIWEKNIKTQNHRDRMGYVSVYYKSIHSWLLVKYRMIVTSLIKPRSSDSLTKAQVGPYVLQITINSDALVQEPTVRHSNK